METGGHLSHEGRKRRLQFFALQTGKRPGTNHRGGKISDYLKRETGVDRRQGRKYGHYGERKKKVK